MSIIATILGVVLGGGSVWGILLKIAGWLGASWATSASEGPILGTIAHAAKGLIDIALWLLKGVIRWLAIFYAGGVDYISKDVRAAVVVATLMWGAWGVGADRWQFWRSIEPPAATASAQQPRISKRSVRRLPTLKEIAMNPGEAVRRAMGGTP